MAIRDIILEKVQGLVGGVGYIQLTVNARDLAQALSALYVYIDDEAEDDGVVFHAFGDAENWKLFHLERNDDFLVLLWVTYTPPDDEDEDDGK